MGNIRERLIDPGLLDSKTSIEDAIEYNTLRLVLYMGEKAPIVMKDIKYDYTKEKRII